MLPRKFRNSLNLKMQQKIKFTMKNYLAVLPNGYFISLSSHRINTSLHSEVKFIICRIKILMPKMYTCSQIEDSSGPKLIKFVIYSWRPKWGVSESQRLRRCSKLLSYGAIYKRKTWQGLFRRYVQNFKRKIQNQQSK